MSDRAPSPRPGDEDIAFGAVFKFAGALGGFSAVVMLLVWGLSVNLRDELALSDPVPSPVAEANVRRLPPEPRLEESPPRNLAELRAREDALLGSWAWVDKPRGVARIPIERAIEILALKGIPEAQGAPPPEGGKK